MAQCQSYGGHCLERMELCVKQLGWCLHTLASVHVHVGVCVRMHTESNSCSVGTSALLQDMECPNPVSLFKFAYSESLQ